MTRRWRRCSVCCSATWRERTGFPPGAAPATSPACAGARGTAGRKRRPSRLALDPGQTGLAPAADRVAVLGRVLVAFEAFEHVVGFAPAGAGRGLGCGM